MNKYVNQVVTDLAKEAGISREQAEDHAAEIEQLFSAGFSRSEIVVTLKKNYEGS